LAAAAHRRWANAIYAIWYPLLPAARHLALLGALERSAIGSILLTELAVAEKGEAGGMYGSGMAIINAPWQTDNILSALLPPVADVLAPDKGTARLCWLARDDAS
jgi:23S rRNA (adenine2030-N6)-methyltransferase